MNCMPQKLKRSKSQQAILDREIRDEMLKLIDRYNKEYDVCIAFALNECAGFGRKRLKRLFKQIIADRLEFRRFYSDDKCSDPKIDVFKMEKMLLKKGINLTEIFDEISKEMFDEVTELNSHSKRKG